MALLLMKEMTIINNIGCEIIKQSLLKIKRIVDEDNNGDKFIIVWTYKNIEFMREYGLNTEDVKQIIRKLTIEDCFAGPEKDRDPQYEGWIYKFAPIFKGIKLYIKIRLESKEKSICLSIHEFGKFDGVN